MSELGVFRTTPNGIERIGTLDERTGRFSYDERYLVSPSAAPISCSLPLKEGPYDQREVRPYFEGLLPEGAPPERPLLPPCAYGPKTIWPSWQATALNASEMLS